MSVRYVIKPKADRDLDDIADYLAEKADIDVSLRFLDAAHQTFALLAKHPQMGWRSRIRHALLKPLRVFRVAGFKNLLIFYRPLGSGVEILRVIHGSRNIEALFRRRGEVD